MCAFVCPYNKLFFTVWQYDDCLFQMNINERKYEYKLL